MCNRDDKIKWKSTIRCITSYLLLLFFLSQKQHVHNTHCHEIEKKMQALTVNDMNKNQIKSFNNRWRKKLHENPDEQFHNRRIFTGDYIFTGLVFNLTLFFLLLLVYIVRWIFLYSSLIFYISFWFLSFISYSFIYLCLDESERTHSVPSLPCSDFKDSQCFKTLRNERKKEEKRTHESNEA